MSGQLRVLVVDDEDCSRELLCTELQEVGFRVATAGDGEEAWSLFCSERVELVVTDLRMPNSDGMALLRRLRSERSPNPQVPVVLVSAYGTLSTAVSAGRCGATDFFALDEQGIPELVARIQEVAALTKVALPPALVGNSTGIQGARERLNAISESHAPILIEGASGAGHREVAIFLHHITDWGGGSFVDFEHWTGLASTDATELSSLYVNDVETLDEDAQERLLEALENSECAGANGAFRVIGSTTKGLSESHGASELATRLGRFVIHLPSLAEREQDIRDLVSTLAQRTVHQLGKTPVRFETTAIAALQRHDWPGELHQLESAVESLVAFATDGMVTERAVRDLLPRLDSPLKRIAERRARKEREELIELYEKHGTFSGVAEELGITRNAAKYRLAKHRLLPQGSGRRT